MKLFVSFSIVMLLINMYLHSTDEKNESYLNFHHQSVCFSNSDTVDGVFLYELTSNFASLNHDIFIKRFPAMILYDTLYDPSISLYQNGIFTFCGDGLCTSFMEDDMEAKKRMVMKQMLDSIATKEITIINKNFDEREDMLRNVITGEETFIYKVVKCSIVFRSLNSIDFFVTNFEKESSEQSDYVKFNSPIFQIDTIMSLTQVNMQ